jgi:hypothetical protein
MSGYVSSQLDRSNSSDIPTSFLLLIFWIELLRVPVLRFDLMRLPLERINRRRRVDGGNEFYSRDTDFILALRNRTCFADHYYLYDVLLCAGEYSTVFTT